MSMCTGRGGRGGQKSQGREQGAKEKRTPYAALRASYARGGEHEQQKASKRKRREEARREHQQQERGGRLDLNRVDHQRRRQLDPQQDRRRELDRRH